MRADIESVLDTWARLNPREGRRLRRLDSVQQIEQRVGPEPVTWFQDVQWWPSSIAAPEPADTDAGLFGPLVDDGPSGEPDSGVLVLTATRVVLIGARQVSAWPLVSVRLSFRPAQFVQSTPPCFVLDTPDGRHRLLPGRRVSHQPMLQFVSDAHAELLRAARSAPAAEPEPDDGGRRAAVRTQLAAMLDRGTITREQFESECRRLG